MNPHQRFRSDIQGLRALAIVPVVLYHAGVAAISGGFVGVDVFFVISGYLITRILLRELDDGTFSIIRFYERRIRRLYPALYLMLVFVGAVGAMLLPPVQYAELGQTMLATVLFVSNFKFLQLSDYFADLAELKPLLHTWSLAVEEQFYVVFPPLLALLARFLPKRMGLVMWLATAASLASCLWLLQSNVSAAFYLPFTRAYELLIGAILARGAVPHAASGKIRDALSMLGLVLILAPMLLYDRATLFPGFAALPPSIGTALVLYAGEGRTSLAGRLISHAPLVFLGSISYSLYLWHWPLLVYARYIALGPLSPRTAGIAVAGALVMATLSWRFVEQPFLKWRISHRRLIGGGIAFMLVGALLGQGIAIEKGLPGRFDARELALLKASRDRNPDRDRCHANGKYIFRYSQACTFGAAGATPDTAVWADSSGAELVVALGDKLRDQGRAVVELTSSGCPPVLHFDALGEPLCARQNDATLEALTHQPNIRRVVMLISYDIYVDDAAKAPAFFARLSHTIALLQQAGKHVILAYPAPHPLFSAPIATGLMARRGQDPATFGTSTQSYLDRYRVAIGALDRLVGETHVGVFKPAARLCANGFCPAYVDGVGAIYFDHVHYSISGARYLLR